MNNVSYVITIMKFKVILSFNEVGIWKNNTTFIYKRNIQNIMEIVSV